MAYGEIKVDTVTFTDGGIDKSVSISGLVQNPTFSGNITVTGTISGNTVQGQTVSGVTVTGTTANFVSGVFTTQISGATITGNVGNFTTITGGTVTLTSGVFASGTAAAPSVSIGTTDNGLYSPGTDQVAVATNGQGRLFVDASGNVGVGTSSVNALLEVNNSTAGGEVQRIEGNYSGSGSVILTNWRRAGGSVAAALKYNDDSSPLCMSIGTTTSHEFRIRTADTDAITIDASQRVGIGTSSPTLKLSVDGDTWFGNGAGVEIGRLFNDSGVLHLRGSANVTGLALGTNNTRAVTIDSSQRVGIGTSSPGQKLDVNGEIVCSPNTAGKNTFQFTTQAADDASLIMRSNTTVKVNIQANGTSYFDGGNVGIGTTSPGNTLHLSGSNGVGVRIENTSNSISAYSTLESSGGLQANISGSGFFSWVTGGGEKVRIDSSGRLGIGTSSPLKKTEIRSAPTTADTDGLRVGDGTRYLEFAQTGATYNYMQVGGNQNLIYFSGSNLSLSTDGANAITLNTNSLERVRVTSAGNVGIGTTSPGATSGARLHVHGSTENSTLAEFGTFNLGRGLLIGTAADGAVNDVYVTYTAQLANYGGHIWKVGSNELARLTKDGQLLVGTSTARSNFFNTTVSSALDVEVSADALVEFSGIRNRDNTSGAAIVLAKSRGTTAGSNTIVTSGDELGRVSFQGSDGSEFVEAAVIQAEVDGTPGANDMPGRLVFSTTADGASSPTERLRITSAGNVGIGTTSPAAPLDVNGAIYSRSTGVYTDAITAYGGSSLAINAGSSNLNITVNASERARIDSSGRLLVGTSSARSIATQSLAIQNEGTSFGTTGFSTCRNSNDLYGPYIHFGKTRGASVGSNTLVSYGDDLGGLIFGGGDGTDVDSQAAYILCQVDGTPGANDMPGRLVFFTTADGASSPTERLRIDSSGRVGIGTTSPIAFNPSLTIEGTDPGFFISNSAATDFYSINVQSGVVSTWVKAGADFAIGRASGITGAGYSESLRIPAVVSWHVF
jgi:hypothetical protein